MSYPDNLIRVLLFSVLIMSQPLFGQDAARLNEYNSKMDQAWNLFQSKKYLDAAAKYSEAVDIAAREPR